MIVSPPASINSGAMGFGKGVALGVVGVVVKPVLGVTDGIANVAHGLSNQMTESVVRPQTRPPRTFERSLIESSDLVLVPVDGVGARAQQFIVKKAEKDGQVDSVISSVLVDGNPRTATRKGGELTAWHMVVITEKFVYMLELSNSDTVEGEVVCCC